MKSRFMQPMFGTAAALVLTIGLSPAVLSQNPDVRAAAKGYGIWVGPIEVTEENKDNVYVGQKMNDGKIKYDPETGVLTLDDAKLFGYSQTTIFGKKKVAIYSEDTLKIEGTATIDNTDIGIMADMAVYLPSEGTVLNIDAAERGIDSSIVDIQDATINVKVSDNDEGCGINAVGDLEINNTDVTVEGGMLGICANNLIELKGFDTDFDITTYGACIFCRGDLNIEGGRYDLKQTGEKKSAAVMGNNIETSGTTTTFNIDCKYGGMFCNEYLWLKDCSVNVKGGLLGIMSDDTLIIRNADVNVDVTKFAVGALSLDVQNKIKLPVNGKVDQKEDDDPEGNSYTFVVDSDNKVAKKVIINDLDLVLVPEVAATLTAEGHKAYYVDKNDTAPADQQTWYADEYGTEKISDHSSVIIPKLSFELPDVKGKEYKEAKKEIEDFLKEKGLSTKINIGYVHNYDTAKAGRIYEVEIFKSPSKVDKVDIDTDYIALYVYENDKPPVQPTVIAEPTTAVEPTTAAEPTTATEPTTAAEPTGTEKPSDKVHDFVDRIYNYVLGREAEEEGAAFWTSELTSGKRTGAEVAQGFIFSDEFTNKGLSDKDFVTVLYKTFFGREPEAEGLKYWVNELETKAKDRAEVANGFIYSQEWANTCADYGIKSGASIAPSSNATPSELVNAFAERMYTTALGRESDESGLAYWTQKLTNKNISGEQLGLCFFLSDEMTSFKLSDEDFLTRLYKTFMDRDADKDGQEYWLGVMKEGKDRSEIVLGFTRSPEFIARCEQAQIIPFV